MRVLRIHHKEKRVDNREIDKFKKMTWISILTGIIFHKATFFLIPLILLLFVLFNQARIFWERIRQRVGTIDNKRPERFAEWGIEIKAICDTHTHMYIHTHAQTHMHTYIRTLVAGNSQHFKNLAAVQYVAHSKDAWEWQGDLETSLETMMKNYTFPWPLRDIHVHSFPLLFFAGHSILIYNHRRSDCTACVLALH